VRRAVRIPENGLSQEQAPGITPENLTSPAVGAGDLAPGKWSCSPSPDTACRGGRTVASTMPAACGVSGPVRERLPREIRSRVAGPGR
jgi:hypothetical protein